MLAIGILVRSVMHITKPHEHAEIGLRSSRDYSVGHDSRFSYAYGSGVEDAGFWGFDTKRIVQISAMFTLEKSGTTYACLNFLHVHRLLHVAMLAPNQSPAARHARISRLGYFQKKFQYTCKSTELMLWESARLMTSEPAKNQNGRDHEFMKPDPKPDVLQTLKPLLPFVKCKANQRHGYGVHLLVAINIEVGFDMFRILPLQSLANPSPSGSICIYCQQQCQTWDKRETLHAAYGVSHNLTSVKDAFKLIWGVKLPI
ncbi:hypothetical protein VNO77_24751 [Canavalia gladiata]|uniref:Uncharacterized protein n=1 Tax=Canavalia gladiata TaxID=3824 RepID=A0AAN9L7K8_CANGL